MQPEFSTSSARPPQRKSSWIHPSLPWNAAKCNAVQPFLSTAFTSCCSTSTLKFHQKKIKTWPTVVVCTQHYPRLFRSFLNLDKACQLWLFSQFCSMTKLNVFSTTCKTLLYTAEKSYRYVELGTLFKSLWKLGSTLQWVLEIMFITCN